MFVRVKIDLKYINVSALVNKNEGSILSSEQFAEMLEKKIEDEKCMKLLLKAISGTLYSLTVT